MFDIIKRPLVTEKNTLRSTKFNEYSFEVALTANRTQIKRAVEKLFNVKVVRVTAPPHGTFRCHADALEEGHREIEGGRQVRFCRELRCLSKHLNLQRRLAAT